MKVSRSPILYDDEIVRNVFLTEDEIQTLRNLLYSASLTASQSPSEKGHTKTVDVEIPYP